MSNTSSICTCAFVNLSLDQINTVHGGVREVVHDGWTAGGGTVQGAATGVNPKLREAGLAALGGCAIGAAFGISGGPEAAVAGCLANGAKAGLTKLLT